jgi:hypothetical protein
LNLGAIAKAYSDCVELEERARTESPSLTEDLSLLRADLHAMLMDALRQANIPFTDRSDAARLAFHLARTKQPIV